MKSTALPPQQNVAGKIATTDTQALTTKQPEFIEQIEEPTPRIGNAGKTTTSITIVLKDSVIWFDWG